MASLVGAITAGTTYPLQSRTALLPIRMPSPVAMLMVSEKKERVAAAGGLRPKPHHVALGDIGLLERHDVVPQRQQGVQLVGQPSNVP